MSCGFWLLHNISSDLIVVQLGRVNSLLTNTDTVSKIAQNVFWRNLLLCHSVKLCLDDNWGASISRISQRRVAKLLDDRTLSREVELRWTLWWRRLWEIPNVHTLAREVDVPDKRVVVTIDQTVTGQDNAVAASVVARQERWVRELVTPKDREIPILIDAVGNLYGVRAILFWVLCVPMNEFQETDSFSTHDRIDLRDETKGFIVLWRRFINLRDLVWRRIGVCEVHSKLFPTKHFRRWYVKESLTLGGVKRGARWRWETRSHPLSLGAVDAATVITPITGWFISIIEEVHGAESAKDQRVVPRRLRKRIEVAHNCGIDGLLHRSVRASQRVWEATKSILDCHRLWIDKHERLAILRATVREP